MENPQPRVYYIVFAALMALLIATLIVAELHLGAAAFFIAALIATVKAALIILYFMHVRYSQPLTWIVALAGFFWLGILFALTLSDYVTRPA